MPKPTLLQNILGRPTRSYTYAPAYDPAPYQQYPQQHLLYKENRSDWKEEVRVSLDGYRPSVESRRPSVDVVEVPVRKAKKVPVVVEQPKREEPKPAIVEQKSEDTDDEDDDVFFTPNQSPMASPRQSTVLTSMIPKLNIHPIPPQPPRIHAVRSTAPPAVVAGPSDPSRPPQLRIPSATISTSTTATTLTSEDAYSNYSWGMTSTTNVTTPSPAISRHSSLSKAVTRSSTSNVKDTQPLAVPHPQHPTTEQREPQQPKKKSRASSVDSHSQTEEWSKDVRWLVNPEDMEAQARKMQAKQAKRRTREPSPAPTPAPVPQIPVPEAATSKLLNAVKDGRVRRSNTTASSSSAGTGSRHGSLDSLPTQLSSHRSLSSQRPRPAPAPAMEAVPSPVPAMLQAPQPRPRPRTNSLLQSQLIAQLRMSDVPELDESASDQLFPIPPPPSTLFTTSSSGTVQPRSHAPSQAPTLAVSTSGPPVMAPSVRLRTSSAPSRPLSTYSTARTHTSGHETVTLPTPMSIPSPLGASTQQGYTSLTLPMAGYVPADPFKAATEGKVDVARLGIGQAAMATVSVIRGAAVKSGLFRRASRSLTRGESGRSGPSSTHSLAFSVRTPPPARVPSTSALVRVHACALDELDALVLRAKMTHDGDSAFGYIPGRAFVGNVVEAGWDCPGVGKGDWVVGLLDIKKSGALAEFVLVDRRRLHRCPAPSATLSIAQLAILPLSGISAHRGARTASTLAQDTRVLILLGACPSLACSQGVMCARMLVAQGLLVNIQIEGEVHAEGISRICEADEVWEGEVQRCLESLAENLAEKEEERFDLVVDCVGGPEVWRAARGVLKSGGQFTTLVGDSPGVAPTLRAQIHSNLRSLRRAFLTPSSSASANAGASSVSVASTKLEKAKRVDYEWISPLHAVDREGEDVKDSLESVVKSANEGVGVPFLSLAEDGQQQDGPTDGVQIVTMERAAEAIDSLEKGGVVVVKVVG